MPNKHRKIVAFTIGLLSGVIICFSIFLVFFNQIDNTNENVAMSTDGYSERKIGVKSKSKLNSRYIPSAYKIPKKTENLINDSLLEEIIEDSLIIDSFSDMNELPNSLYQSNVSSNDNDEIVVRKDEMIFVRNIKPSGESPLNNDGQNLDSLLVDNNSNNIKILSYQVEFWKSPINYKGYKMDNDKIVLFGIYEYAKVKLRWTNETLFLDYLDNVYKLEETSGFEPFVLIQSKDF